MKIEVTHSVELPNICELPFDFLQTKEFQDKFVKWTREEVNWPLLYSVVLETLGIPWRGLTNDAKFELMAELRSLAKKRIPSAYED